MKNIKIFLCIAIALLLNTKCFAANTLVLDSSNLFTSTNWLVGDSTSLNDSEAANTALTASFVSSTAFTPGAITADGVAIKIASRAAGAPSNTITVRLANAGADVVGTDVTMNVSDIPQCTSTAITANECGWFYFKFNSAGVNTPVLLLAATAYTLQIKLSATTTAVNVYSASTTNWSRVIPSTTTAAPGAGDRMIIAQGQLAAGSKESAPTITMDNTATTSFGSTTTQAITVNNGATLTFGSSASTNYYLKHKGVVRAFSAGTINIGTSGTRIPSTSTAVLEADATAAVDSGLEIANGATLNLYGAAFANTHGLLTADAAAAATSLTVSSTSNWGGTDSFVFSSTTQTATQFETKAGSSIGSSTTLTLASGLTNAHGGNSSTGVQGEIGDITRNVKIRGVSSTLVGYVYIAATATVNIDGVEFSSLGNSTTSKRGIEVATTTGTFSMVNSSNHDDTVATAIALNITGTSGNNITVQNNVFYNMNCTGLSLASTTATGYLIDSNLIIGDGSGCGSGGMALSDLGGTITNNIVTSTQSGANIIISASEAIGTFTGNSAHSGASHNMTIGGAASGTIGTYNGWRGGGAGSGGISITGAAEVVIDTANLFGNSGGGIVCSNGGGRWELNNSTVNAGATLTQPVGILISGSCNFGLNNTTLGGTTTHATGDLNISSAATVYGTANNSLFASATEIANQTNLTPSSYIGSQKHDQTSGLNKTWRKYGTVSIDTTIFDTTPSVRMTPNTANSKLEVYLPLPAVVASGSTATISIKVRESVVGDGTAYNGNHVRLILKKNVAMGITADTVLATATAGASGAFQTLTATTGTFSEAGVAQFTVDCDGTTGWVNFDTLTPPSTLDSTGFAYWVNGTPVAYGNNSSGSGGGSFTYAG